MGSHVPPADNVPFHCRGLTISPEFFFFSLFLLLKPERETWSQSDPRAEVYCPTAAQKPQNVHVGMVKFAHLLLLFGKPQRDSLV